LTLFLHTLLAVQLAFVEDARFAEAGMTKFEHALFAFALRNNRLLSRLVQQAQVRGRIYLQRRSRGR
jgi:hypothetical protein